MKPLETDIKLLSYEHEPGISVCIYQYTEKVFSLPFTTRNGAYEQLKTDLVNKGIRLTDPERDDLFERTHKKLTSKDATEKELFIEKKVQEAYKEDPDKFIQEKNFKEEKQET